MKSEAEIREALALSDKGMEHAREHSPSTFPMIAALHGTLVWVLDEEDEICTTKESRISTILEMYERLVEK